MSHDEGNGAAYPFSLADKLARITEPHPWYTPDGGASSPWGRAVVPMEMISVLANKSGNAWPVRSPALGLFLDLEIRLLDGPVFVDQHYAVEREVLGLSAESTHRVVLDQDHAQRRRHRPAGGDGGVALWRVQGVVPRLPQGV